MLDHQAPARLDCPAHCLQDAGDMEDCPMKIETLHIGMKVRHGGYGLGVVKTIGEHTAEIRFDDGLKTVAPDTADLAPAEPQVSATGLTMPLEQLIEQTARAIFSTMGLERPDQSVEQLAARWQAGRLVLHPSDPTLQTKEVPLEQFFHKVVGIRNQLRVLEQKINSQEKLGDAEKVELQQYITRCYGALTTFNLLFKDKRDQFVGSSAA
jgi:hypothetical protein